MLKIPYFNPSLTTVWNKEYKTYVQINQRNPLKIASYLKLIVTFNVPLDRNPSLKMLALIIPRLHYVYQKLAFTKFKDPYFVYLFLFRFFLFFRRGVCSTVYWSDRWCAGSSQAFANNSLAHKLVTIIPCLLLVSQK